LRNLREAKEIVKGNLGSYGMIILSVLVLGLVLGALSLIPVLGSLAIIIGGIFAVVMEANAIKAVAVDNQPLGFVGILTEGFNKFKEVWFDTTKSYLFMVVCLAPFILIGLVTLLAPILAGFAAGSMDSVVSGLIGTSLLILIYFIVLISLSVFFQYRFNYKVAGYVSGTDGKEVLKGSTGDIVKMTLVLMATMLLTIIPFIGEIICLLLDLYLGFVYSTKVMLDVNEGASISYTESNYDSGSNVEYE